MVILRHETDKKTYSSSTDNDRSHDANDTRQMKNKSCLLFSEPNSVKLYLAGLKSSQIPNASRATAELTEMSVQCWRVVAIYSCCSLARSLSVRRRPSTVDGDLLTSSH